MIIIDGIYFTVCSSGTISDHPNSFTLAYNISISVRVCMDWLCCSYGSCWVFFVLLLFVVVCQIMLYLLRPAVLCCCLLQWPSYWLIADWLPTSPSLLSQLPHQRVGRYHLPVLSSQSLWTPTLLMCWRQRRLLVPATLHAAADWLLLLIVCMMTCCFLECYRF